MNDATPDTSRLTPANDNPWYLMMTLCGEQEGEKIDRDLAIRNRKLWNAWICQRIAPEERQRIADKIGIDPEETEWTEDKAQEIEARFAARAKQSSEPLEIPDSVSIIDLSKIAFSNTFVLEKAIFLTTYFIGAHFGEETFFTDTYFGERTHFDGVQFNGFASFNRAHFGKFASFTSALFCKTTYFTIAQFGRWAAFDDAHFDEETYFMGAYFGDNAVFDGAYFGKTTRFTGARFGKTTAFPNVRFEEIADFCDAEFGNSAYFTGAHFGERTSFDGAHFGETTSFSGAKFGGSSYFDKVHFGSKQDNRPCRPDFSNAVFGGSASFEGAEFATHFPVLSGATLHDTTTFNFDPKLWPDRPGAFNWLTLKIFGRKRQRHAEAKASVAKLRHVMTKQALPEEEHFFFRREMHHAARAGSFWQTAHIYLFEAVSDFGHSIVRPAILLFLLWVAGGVFYWLKASFDVWTAAGYSFSTMFKFFGLQRTFMTEQTKLLEDVPWGEPVAAAQTVLAFILLFFLGLGLRTRFRLR